MTLPDFLRRFRGHHIWPFRRTFTRRRLPKGWRYALWTFTSIIGFIVITSLPFGIQAVRSGTKVRTALNEAKSAATKQDFPATYRALDDVAGNTAKTQKAMGRLIFIRPLPVIGTQIKAIESLLEAGGQLSQALKRLAGWAEETLDVLADDSVSLSKLSPEDTKAILQGLAEGEPELQGVKAEIDLAIQTFNTIPHRGLLSPVRKTVEPLRTTFTNLQESIGRLVPLSRFLPPLVGYPKERTYLFLLQNNTELRPTGGFIGTYGVMTFRDGQISSFTTDNSYNLDLQARGKLKVEPPEPLARYNFSEGWFFRDSNWSPDFPTAAEQAQWFYRNEGGTSTIDGVIAVTPTFVSSLLKLTGPIKVNGSTITSQNLVEFLRFQVDEGYLREGLPFSERKEVVGILAKELLGKIYGLNKTKWVDLWRTIERDITEKHVLVYVNDDELQATAEALNWAGAIQNSSGDFLSVIDANIGSLKSDPYVKRSLDYGIAPAGDALEATLRVTYTHEGELSKTVTRYRTYTRVLVPEGAELLHAEGPMVECKVERSGSVKTEIELGKTVLGFFLCIEPKETKSFTLTYRLPGRLRETFNANRYELLVQKQPGTPAYPLSVTVNGARITEGSFLDELPLVVDNTRTIQTSLAEDRHILITLDQ